MQRLALDIDPIAVIRNTFGKNDPDPSRAVVLAELGGVESIVCYLRDDHKTVNERDIAVLRQILTTHLNIRCNITEETIRAMMRVKPDMITFVAPGSVKEFTPAPLNPDTYASQLQNYLPELRSNNILSSVLIEPELTMLKAAGRLGFDYVELDTGSLAEAEDMNQELELLDQIGSLALAANKIGMGVNVSGKINSGFIKDLSRIELLEDIIIGEPIIIKGLAIGIEQAVRDYLTHF